MKEDKKINKELKTHLDSRKKSKKFWFWNFKLHRNAKNRDTIPEEKVKKILESLDNPQLKSHDSVISDNNKKLEKKSNQLKEKTNFKIMNNQKKIQKKIKEKEVIEEHNKDALEIWHISQKLFEYLPVSEQTNISNLKNFKKFRRKIEEIK